MVNNLCDGTPICVKDKIINEFLNFTLTSEMRCIFLWWTVFLHKAGGNNYGESVFLSDSKKKKNPNLSMNLRYFKKILEL